MLTLARVLPLTLALLVSSVAGGGTADDVGNLAIADIALAAALFTSTLSVRRDPGDLSASIAVALLAIGLFAATTTFDNPARTLSLATASAVLLLHGNHVGSRPGRPGGRPPRSSPQARRAPRSPCWRSSRGHRPGSSRPGCCCSRSWVWPSQESRVRG